MISSGSTGRWRGSPALEGRPVGIGDEPSTGVGKHVRSSSVRIAGSWRSWRSGRGMVAKAGGRFLDLAQAVTPRGDCGELVPRSRNRSPRPNGSRFSTGIPGPHPAQPVPFAASIPVEAAPIDEDVLAPAASRRTAAALAAAGGSIRARRQIRPGPGAFGAGIAFGRGQARKDGVWAQPPAINTCRRASTLHGRASPVGGQGIERRTHSRGGRRIRHDGDASEARIEYGTGTSVL